MNETFKKSQYNLRIDHVGKTYLYNSFLNSFAIINEATDLFLQTHEHFPADLLADEVRKSLLYGGFIVAEQRDELAELKVRNRIGRFAGSSFGLTIAPTMACNFKCQYCFQEAATNKMSQQTVEDVYSYVVRNLKGKSSFGVCWYGGEPLLALDTIEELSQRFIDLCSTLRIPYEADIISNGYLMNEPTAKMLQQLKVNFWQVTLDGPPAIHDVRRALKNGAGSFEQVFNNLIHNHKYFDRVSVRVNVDRDNLQYVAELLDLLDEAGLKNKVSIYPGRVEAFGASKGKAVTCFPEADFADIQLVLYREAMQRGFIINRRPSLQSSYCTADQINSFVVDAGGRLTKCWNSIGLDKECVGSVTDSVLNHNYSRWLSYDPFEDRVCLECRLLPICMGGCPYNRVIEGQRSCKEIKYNLESLLKLRIDEKRKEATELLGSG